MGDDVELRIKFSLWSVSKEYVDHSHASFSLLKIIKIGTALSRLGHKEVGRRQSCGAKNLLPKWVKALGNK